MTKPNQELLEKMVELLNSKGPWFKYDAMAKLILKLIYSSLKQGRPKERISLDKWPNSHPHDCVCKECCDANVTVGKDSRLYNLGLKEAYDNEYSILKSK
jgi:hypothetical protein